MKIIIDSFFYSEPIEVKTEGTRSFDEKRKFLIYIDKHKNLTYRFYDTSDINRYKDVSGENIKFFKLPLPDSALEIKGVDVDYFYNILSSGSLIIDRKNITVFPCSFKKNK